MPLARQLQLGAMDVYDGETYVTALDDVFGAAQQGVVFTSLGADGAASNDHAGGSSSSRAHNIVRTAPRGPLLLRNLRPAPPLPRRISIDSASVSASESSPASPLHSHLRCFLIACEGRTRAFRPLCELFEPGGAGVACPMPDTALPRAHVLRMVCVTSAATWPVTQEVPVWAASRDAATMTLAQLEEFLHARLREMCVSDVQQALYAASRPLPTLRLEDGCTHAMTLAFHARLPPALQREGDSKSHAEMKGVTLTMAVSSSPAGTQRHAAACEAFRIAAPGGSASGIVLYDRMWTPDAAARGTLDATVASSGERGAIAHSCPLCSRAGPVFHHDAFVWHINSQHVRVRATVGKPKAVTSGEAVIPLVTLTADADDADVTSTLRKDMLAMAHVPGVRNGLLAREGASAALVSRAKKWDVPAHVHKRRNSTFVYVAPTRANASALRAPTADVATAKHERASARVGAQSRDKMSTLARAHAYNGMGNALPPGPQQHDDITPSNFATASSLVIESIAREGTSALPTAVAAAAATIARPILPSSSPASAARASLPVPPGSMRVYYHARTGQPYLPHEVDVDSDDDTHDGWILHETASRIASYGDIAPSDAAFMMLWNEWTHAHPICADARVAEACVAFAMAHARKLALKEYRAAFVMHLCNVWDYALVDASTIMRCLRIVDEAGQTTGAEAAAAVALAKEQTSQPADDADDLVQVEAVQMLGGNGFDFAEPVIAPLPLRAPVVQQEQKEVDVLPPAPTRESDDVEMAPAEETATAVGVVDGRPEDEHANEVEQVEPVVPSNPPIFEVAMPVDEIVLAPTTLQPVTDDPEQIMEVDG